MVTLTYVILNGVKHYRTTDSGTISILSGKEKKSRKRRKKIKNHFSSEEKQFRRNTLLSYFLYLLLIQAKYFFGLPPLCREKAFITLNAVSGFVSACNSAVYHHSKSEKHRKIRLINTTAVCLTLHSGKV